MLTVEELQLVTFFDQYYRIHGELLTADVAEEKYGIPSNLTARSIKKSDFRKALEERGIILNRYEKPDDWASKSLTPLQLLVANTLLDAIDTRTHKKKLQDLKVSTNTYNAWLKDPVFKEYLQTRAEQLLGENKHEINTALLDKVRSGDIKAISYLNEMLGIFTPQRASNQNFDVHGLIVKIIEIIDETVSNGEEKLEIANRLKKLIAARNVASQLTGEFNSDQVGVKEIAEVIETEAPLELEQPDVVQVNPL